MFFFSFWNGNKWKKIYCKEGKQTHHVLLFSLSTKSNTAHVIPILGGKKKVIMRPIPFTLLNTFGMLPLPWSCYMKPRSQAQSQSLQPVQVPGYIYIYVRFGPYSRVLARTFVPSFSLLTPSTWGCFLLQWSVTGLHHCDVVMSSW